MIITKTTETAFKMLQYLRLNAESGVIPLQKLSVEFGGSPSYLATIAHLLVKGGLLVSHRGPQGGFALAPGAQETPLLKVVELCQGLPEAAYCSDQVPPRAKTCVYHDIMAELHEAVLAILGNRTIEDLIRRPFGCTANGELQETCRMRQKS